MIDHLTTDGVGLIDGGDGPPGALVGCALWLFTALFVVAVLLAAIWAAS